MRVRVAGSAAMSIVGLLLGPALLVGQMAIAPGTVVAGTLSFDGHASLGDFTGNTSAVTGEMSGGPTLASISGWVEAPVKTILTGKGKRDADMNKSMESDKYPVIRYELDSVAPGALSGDTIAVRLHGRFVIHGVTRAAELAGRVSLSETGAHLWADTPLNLKDYKIGGLSKVFGILKMNEHIEVRVDVVFGPTPTEAGPGPAATQ